MNLTTIRQLNKLNRDFYNQVTEYFSESRSFYWQGWNKLVPYIQDLSQSRQEVIVLDLGCGNGRFGQFMQEQVEATKLHYIGVDNNPALLKEAQQKLASAPRTTFKKVDLVESVLNHTFDQEFSGIKAHCVVLLGVLHHIPSFQLRSELLQAATQLLIKGGYLVFTTWNFVNSPRLQKKQVDSERVGLYQDQLEPNDMILDWKRGVTAYRYCHYTDDAERQLLATSTELEQVTTFTADGKTGKLNTYTVLQK